MAQRIIYEKGQIVGPYQAVYIEEIEPFIEKSGRKRRAAKFQCGYCGKYFNSIIGNVKSGGTRSCGCQAKIAKSNNGKRNAKDLTNMRFGNLVAIHSTDERNRNQIV